MIVARRATVQDAAAIAHVHVDSWRTTYTGLVPASYLATLDEVERASQWREWLAQDAVVFVAEQRRKIVGFAAGGRIREPLSDCDAELFAIYLLHRAQRQGTGTLLLGAIATALHARGFRSMAVWVLDRNASVSFYTRTGAERCGSKDTEVGGVLLPVSAYRWLDLAAIVQH